MATYSLRGIDSYIEIPYTEWGNQTIDEQELKIRLASFNSVTREATIDITVTGPTPGLILTNHDYYYCIGLAPVYWITPTENDFTYYHGGNNTILIEGREFARHSVGEYFNGDHFQVTVSLNTVWGWGIRLCTAIENKIVKQETHTIRFYSLFLNSRFLSWTQITPDNSPSNIGMDESIQIQFSASEDSYCTQIDIFGNNTFIVEDEDEESGYKESSLIATYQVTSPTDTITIPVEMIWAKYVKESFTDTDFFIQFHIVEQSNNYFAATPLSVKIPNITAFQPQIIDYAALHSREFFIDSEWPYLQGTEVGFSTTAATNENNGESINIVRITIGTGTEAQNYYMEQDNAQTPPSEHPEYEYFILNPIPYYTLSAGNLPYTITVINNWGYLSQIQGTLTVLQYSNPMLPSDYESFFCNSDGTLNNNDGEYFAINVSPIITSFVSPTTGNELNPGYINFYTLNSNNEEVFLFTKNLSTPSTLPSENPILYIEELDDYNLPHPQTPEGLRGFKIIAKIGDTVNSGTSHPYNTYETTIKSATIIFMDFNETGTAMAIGGKVTDGITGLEVKLPSIFRQDATFEGGINSIEIPATADLNDYITGGFYYGTSVVTNMPGNFSSILGFTLEVIDGAVHTQKIMVIENSFSSVTPLDYSYERTYSFGGWTSWKRIFDTIDLIYPVGSIYMSTNSTSPATLFGGTWVQIEDTFLLSAGQTYTAGDTGGEATHKLLTSEMPSHTHAASASSYGEFWVHSTNTSYGSNVVSSGTGHYITSAKNTQPTGSDQPHNNMPPYLVVYMWERTA